MPRFLLILPFLILTACTRPIGADFIGEEMGLRDDQMLWIQRVPSDARFVPWKDINTIPDSVQIRSFNKPVFDQIMPTLIRDLLEGKLTAYEDLEFSEEEKPIKDLQERLARLGGSSKDYSSFTREFEVLKIVQSSGGMYNAETRFLRVMWHDPRGLLPSRSFASVKFSEIEQAGYRLEIGGGTLSFTEFLRREPYFNYPVYVRSNQVEYSLNSAGEATYLRERVTTGHWDQVKWIDGSINASGEIWTEVPPGALDKIGGVYEFPATDSLKGPRLLYLEPETDYLLADWTHKYKNEKFFPFREDACFNAASDFLFFSQQEYGDSMLIVATFVSGQDTIAGWMTRKL